MTPDVQALVAVWYGAAGSNVNSCDVVRTALGKDADLVDTVRYGNCGNVDFLNSLYLWKTPAGRLRRRPRQHLHGLLGLAAEVDGGPRSLVPRSRERGVRVPGPPLRIRPQRGGRVASVSTPAGDAGGGIRRVSAFLFRHPRVKLGALLVAPLLWFTVIYLGALAVLFVSAFWRLDVFTGEIVKQFGLLELRDAAARARVSHDRHPHGRDRRRGDARRHRAVVPLGVLRRAGRDTARPQRVAAHGRDPAVGELPRPRVRLAIDPHARGLPELGRSFHRFLAPARQLELGDLAHVRVPVAAVHAAADLRRHGARPELVPRGLERPRRQGVDHVPSRRVPAHRAGDRRRVDLLVLAHARRLHRAEPGGEHAVHRER